MRKFGIKKEASSLEGTENLPSFWRDLKCDNKKTTQTVNFESFF